MDGHAATYDVHYWHPHGTPKGKESDLPRRTFGFPTVPGLLRAARRPFRAAGLDVPWYAAFGNHDGLVQGNVPAGTSNLSAVATGPVKLFSPPAGYSPAQLEGVLRGGDLAGFLQSLADDGDPGIRLVTPDPQRRLLTRAEIVEQHFHTTGLPVGHGFTARNRTDGTAYYAFTRGLLRVIVLDTVNPNGYADGSVDLPQLQWLQAQLAAATDKLVVVCSHHTSTTMDNLLVGTGGDPTPRVPGSQVVAELLANRNVIAWVNGHTHTNGVTPHKRTGGGGFWEINTASHVDWPQHARVIEVLDNRDGTLSIFGTLIDHASPVSHGGDISDAPHLASLARELAANDPQARSVDQGPRNGRNVELLVRAPAWL
jgi:metallophosphoesterase (TIGR03767 family)